ncbi:MAG TPA: carboxypeptidase-like regulatory domain-containing protein, partial [Acidobacteriaceae bacterium]|nr:carboxypeptidase-like regulatory domain-containing protein [Acidobacteriaceae bacterium]
MSLLSVRKRRFATRAAKAGITAVCAALLAIATPAALFAQTANGTIRGLVTDPDAAIIPGADITLTPASGNPVNGKSGSDGTYRVSAPAGVYTMTVTMPGFATMTKANLKITAGTTVALDIKLVVGDQTTTINVTSDAATVSVDSDSNASSTVIKGDDLKAL